MVEIRHRYTGEVICVGETLLEAVKANLKHLRGSNLSGSNLSECRHEIRRLQDVLRKVRSKLEQIVETEGTDKGVIFGDALIELYEMTNQ